MKIVILRTKFQLFLVESKWKKYFNDEIYMFFEKNIPDSIDKITYEKLNKFK
jgi:hypothetical protein